MTNELEGKWTTSTNGSEFDGQNYDTKEEAIESMRKMVDQGYYGIIKERGKFWVGQIYCYAPDQFFLAEDLIDGAWQRANDESGEYAEDYLADVTDEQKDELSQLILGWVEKHDLKPNFYGIKNSEEVAITKHIGISGTELPNKDK